MQPIHAGGSRPDVGRSRSGTSRTWAIGARLAGLVLGALTSGALGLVAIPVAGAGASTTTTGSSGGVESLTSVPTDNFWLASAQGAVWNFGTAGSYGSAAGLPLNHPIVAITPTGDAKGYWLVASDGGIFSYGDAGFYGSTGSIALNKPIVGMTPTPDGKGYWMVASDGGIFSYGDAGFYGSTGSIALNKPIVGMTPTPDGKGYWLVASDGGIFSYGDAGFYGSTGFDRAEQAHRRHDDDARRQGVLDGRRRRRDLQLR